MPTNEGFSGVSNCYVFKSRLQEYAQKVGLPTPVYDTIKEGPSHEPFFRSTVTMKDVRYDSLPGFFNRKAAEQSAAEVALMELTKAGEIDASVSQPVHETGLCKNLLQEYAQKMNYAIPLYVCERDETASRGLIFKCTVEIGGIRYIGASARTKKEAEIKAARTALLAIQSSGSDDPSGNSQLTVIPCRKRGMETGVQEETSNVLKPKKARFKKRRLKKKLSRGRVGATESGLTDNLDNIDGESGSKLDKNDGSAVQEASCATFAMVSTKNSEVENPGTNLIEIETSDVKDTFQGAGYSESGQLVASNFNHSNHGISAGTSAEANAASKVTGIVEVASVANNSALTQIEASNA